MPIAGCAHGFEKLTCVVVGQAAAFTGRSTTWRRANTEGLFCPAGLLHSRLKRVWLCALYLRWYERLPVARGWVDWVVLATCGGANIRLVCDDDPRFDYSQ